MDLCSVITVFFLCSTNLPFPFLSLLSPVPMWAVGAIVVVVLALVGCLGFCIYKKCINKGKKPKKARERKGGRGRRKKDKEGEEGEEKKVRKDDFLFFKKKKTCTTW